MKYAALTTLAGGLVGIVSFVVCQSCFSPAMCSLSLWEAALTGIATAYGAILSTQDNTQSAYRTLQSRSS